nr:MAG: protein m25.1 [Herpesviridae sp.]
MDSSEDVIASVGEDDEVNVSGIVDVFEFLSACGEPDEFERFCIRNKGCRLYLTWPLGCFVLFRSDGELFFTGNDLRRLSDEYLCCREQLSVIGCVIGSFADHRYLCTFGNVADIVHRLPIVLLGEESRVYLYDREDDAVYLLAEDVPGFIKKGLRRFLPIHNEFGLTVVSHNEFTECVDVPAFALAHRDEAYELPWPRAAYVRLMEPKIRRIRESAEEAQMMYFGYVSGRFLDPEFREILLAVDETGEIFSYNPWNFRLIRIARHIRELFVIGLRRVKKTYCYRPGSRIDRQVPRCPHVPRIHLPFPLTGVDSRVRCLTRMIHVWCRDEEKA